MNCYSENPETFHVLRPIGSANHHSHDKATHVATTGRSLGCVGINSCHPVIVDYIKLYTGSKSSRVFTELDITVSICSKSNLEKLRRLALFAAWDAHIGFSILLEPDPR